ncbi:hypothetical protein RTBOTA2_000100 [Rhodotorula toruloides]|nr:hypothetical protein RTBOTA2_000100 [Rhodotorula toruloides]
MSNVANLADQNKSKMDEAQIRARWRSRRLARKASLRAKLLQMQADSYPYDRLSTGSRNVFLNRSSSRHLPAHA